MGAFLLVRFILPLTALFALKNQSSVPLPSTAAHNARFDFHFLNAEFSRARWKGGLHTGICTLALAKKVLGGAAGHGAGSYRLGDLVQVRVVSLGFSLTLKCVHVCFFFALDEEIIEHLQRYSLNAKSSHRAHDDAHATAHLLRLLLREAQVIARCVTRSKFALHLHSASQGCAHGGT